MKSGKKINKTRLECLASGAAATAVVKRKAKKNESNRKEQLAGGEGLKMKYGDNVAYIEFVGSHFKREILLRCLFCMRDCMRLWVCRRDVPRREMLAARDHLLGLHRDFFSSKARISFVGIIICLLLFYCSEGTGTITAHTRHDCHRRRSARF